MRRQWSGKRQLQWKKSDECQLGIIIGLKGRPIGRNLRTQLKKGKHFLVYFYHLGLSHELYRSMMKLCVNAEFLEKCKSFGVGHRKYDDKLFAEDPPLRRYGIYDEDDDHLGHEVIITTCHIPGCRFTTDSLLDFENHYNASHRYACSQCKKLLPSPHLLDLHIQENHDSFFAVMSEKKPSYSCFIEECKEKFSNAEDRLNHCVKIHRLPKDYRFDQLYGAKKNKRNKKPNVTEKGQDSMEVDSSASQNKNTKSFAFSNSKQKGFVNFTGKKFTHENKDTKNTNVNIDQVMAELKETLPS